jgi:hypothetical protein
MMFPAGRARLIGGLASLAVLVAATVVMPGAEGRADPDPPPPPLRNVKYTVFSERPYLAEIYYRDTDPPNWGEYSHNPYLYSPNVEVEVGPDKQWNLEVWLANPDAWAMVVAGISSDSSATTDASAMPNLHCVLAVDGVIVKTAQGHKGALCSIRSW